LLACQATDLFGWVYFFVTTMAWRYKKVTFRSLHQVVDNIHLFKIFFPLRLDLCYSGYSTHLLREIWSSNSVLDFHPLFPQLILVSPDVHPSSLWIVFCQYLRFMLPRIYGKMGIQSPRLQVVIGLFFEMTGGFPSEGRWEQFRRVSVRGTWAPWEPST
jgi:hypothetical protein